MSRKKVSHKTRHTSQRTKRENEDTNSFVVNGDANGILEKNGAKVRCLSLIALLILSGCAADQGISVGALNAVLGNTTQLGETVASQTASTSVAKEAVVHQSWKSYYENQSKVHKNSGTIIEFGWTTLSDGTRVQTMKKLTSREYVALKTPPEKPSEHPVWNTVGEMTRVLAKYGLIGFGIYELAGAWEVSMTGAKGTTYQGPLLNSQNQAEDSISSGGEYIFGRQANDSFNPGE
jgi:hypothetical protein